MRSTICADAAPLTIAQNTQASASTTPHYDRLRSGIIESAHIDTPLYGLDIETDTSVDGLDPAVSPVVGVAIVGAGVEIVLDGPEATLLTDLQSAVEALPAGVLITWNGSAFDLPFLVDRAQLVGVTLGLRIRHDPDIVLSREPLRGHPGAYRGRWNQHRHLDGYRLYRSEIDPDSGQSCGLKPLARHFGFDVIEVERDHIHELDRDELRRYVASDAALARALIVRRWNTARAAIDA